MYTYKKTRWFFLLITCICFFFEGYSQSKQLNAKTHQALNNYVDYINDNVHALWAFHLKFRKFNNDLVNYYLTPYQHRKAKEPVFEYEDILGNRASYHRLPVETYLKTVKESEFLSVNFRYGLNDKLWKIKEIMKEINLIARDVQAYTENEIFLTDTKLEDGYELLQRIENAFNNFNAAKDDLYFSVESAFMSYSSPIENEEYLRHSEQLESLVDYSREILEDTKHTNRDGVEKNCTLLKATILAIKEKENVDMSEGARHYDPIRKVGDKGVYVRYDFVLQQAKKIHDYGLEYLASEEKDDAYGPNGAAYYFYNKRLTYNFNRYGRGVVLQYNKYVDSSQVHLLKQVEEPHWFKAAHIKFFKNELFVDKDFQEAVEPPSPLQGFAANNLIFLVDVSSSMNTPEKIELLKNSVKQLRGHMRPEDHVCIIKYSGDAEVILEPTSSTEKEEIHSAIDNLKPGGKSNVEEGLRLAYEVLDEYFINSGNNKIILASDGDFEVPKRTLRFIKTKGDEDKMLSIFYFGKVEKDDLRSKLTEMTDMGRGNYSYVRNDNLNLILIEEAKRIVY